MDIKTTNIATISGASQIDHAIARLVLAFVADPIARWLYDEPQQFLLHLPRMFRALGASSFAAGGAHRAADGLGVALWLPPGIDAAAEPLEAIVEDSIAQERQAEVGALFERAEQYRPIEPHWYLSLIGVETTQRGNGHGSALMRHALRLCDEAHLPAYVWSSNPQNISLYARHGFKVAGTVQVGSSPFIFPMLRTAR
jgi:ribosomal protein S18 acetylase RimI-like enzyme